MRSPGPRTTKAVLGIAALLSIVAAYWVGYRAGLNAKAPRPWALAVVTKGSSSYTWFDLNNPREAREFREEEARLKSAGAQYFALEGQYKSTLEAKYDPRLVNSHR